MARRHVIVAIAAIAALAAAVMSFLATAANPAGTVRIHYNRAAADYGGWAVYTWNGALDPSPAYPSLDAPDGSDDFGVFFNVAVKPDATFLNFILHGPGGGPKNCGDDMKFDFTPVGAGGEIWQLEGDCTIYLTRPALKVGDVKQAKAHWLTRSVLAWPKASPSNTYRLYYARSGGITSGESGISGGQWIPLVADGAGLPTASVEKFPHLIGATALELADSDLAKVPDILKGQIVIAKFAGTRLIDATAAQIPGVLDDQYTFNGELGAIVRDNHDRDSSKDRDDLAHARGAHGGVLFRLWAPTAQSVKLHVFDSPKGTATSVVPMSFNPRDGVWRAQGDKHWVNRHYLYEVQVFVRATGKLETNMVTDPYSLGLAANSARTLIVDLDDQRLKPRQWDRDERPTLAQPEDIALYELHVRDFSASDSTVPPQDRGKFRAFTHLESNGMRHLAALREAGLTHIHLLPVFDISSVPEVGCITPVIRDTGPDSPAQQAAIAPLRDRDCFNWGYDPVHYTVPEGSYASTADGTARIREFREMVGALHETGLRVVMDVVYNHTTASGQGDFSVLDKIVPGYYHRLDENGFVANSTCCANTATEHAMMGKLLTDSVLTWAREYHVDGFRFDLMGHQPKALMVELERKLAAIDPSSYIYGEGWNFGEVANNARFVQASQPNLAGTGIGTFSDRMRDAVRGGGPFDGGESLISNQGFINGLWYDNNTLAGAPQDWQKQRLLQYSDWIRLGLAGTLKDFVFVDKDGNTKTGAEIDYNGQPAGYVTDPQEVINYISAHDNQTLFDNNQFKLPTTVSQSDRVRVNNLGVAIALLSQGIPLFHAGDDILRSKSLDRDSFNSGDWFNRLDFTYQSNNWAVGLPPQFTGNEPNWSVMQPLLANPALEPGLAEITAASAYFRETLALRKSSRLFRLATGEEVKARLKFHNIGPNQIPGLIAMSLSDEIGSRIDPRYKSIVVVFNADKAGHSLEIPAYVGKRMELHPIQRDSIADSEVKKSDFSADDARFTVPARTTAVFVEPRH
jgi:pullulanase/glycogen debranching enzyme